MGVLKEGLGAVLEEAADGSKAMPDSARSSESQQSTASTTLVPKIESA